METLTDENKLQHLKNFIKDVQKKEYGDSYLIAVMHEAQRLYGYLPKDIMEEIAQMMQIPTARIWGVATFYHYFHLEPRGQFTVSVCLGTACYVKGAQAVMDTIKDHLKIDVGQTSEDGIFYLEGARCLGACGLAPVAMIGDKIHGGLTPKKTIDILNEYRKNAKKVK